MNTLVVARWQENTGWIVGVPHGWDVDVVQKETDLPNVGREPSSYLWWIDTHYEKIDPASLYAFVQGDPFDHDVHLFDDLEDEATGFVPLALGEPYRCDGTGRPHHPGVPVAACHQRWFGSACPDEVRFWPGGQFKVDGATLLRHEQTFYRRIFDDLMDNEGLSPWAAERLWPLMFSEERWHG